jgi:hypothetical protein
LNSRLLKLQGQTLTTDLTPDKQIGRYIDSYDVTLDVCLPTEKQQAYRLTQLVCIYTSSILFQSRFSFAFLINFFMLDFIYGLARGREDRCL